MCCKIDPQIRRALHAGLVIPAHPLALDASRHLDERRQRALTRYYIDAGAGGLAIGVHTTQFAIRNPDIGLFEPVLQLAAEEMSRADSKRSVPLVRIGGICGDTRQALREARILHDLRYHAGLLSLAALREANDAALLAHCRLVAEVLPIVGFYLQPSVGGRPLSCPFWRDFAEIENVAAIKIAPFNRYQTLDVIRAVAESGADIALYTGNDDNIVMDLLTPYVVVTGKKSRNLHFSGGLLGHWAVWSRPAVQLLADCKAVVHAGDAIPQELLRRAIEVTDCNAAFFDASNNFAGCIAGLHEVLRRQGLLNGIWCLEPAEGLSPGQSHEIDRVYSAYPHLNDDDFVRSHLDRWLST